MKQLIDLLQKRNAPSFYFLHSLLPHYPFVFNERGQLHANKFSFLTMHFREATGVNNWPDETTANLAYQAHLLQLSFTDLLLGLVLDRLAQQDLLEESLIIVTSDHGTNFYWDSAGLPSDTLAAVQASGTLYVPLLIKLPGQSTGRISDGPVQTIDIVPTIAEILGMKTPWEVDGVSVLDRAPKRRERIAYLPEHTRIGAGEDRDERSLRRKIELFGTHSLDGIYRLGPHPEMLGMSVTSFPSNTSTATVRLNHPERYRAGADPTGQRVPAYVEGEIENLPEDIEASDLAIVMAINGVIRSTTKTTQEKISSLLPEGRAPSRSPSGESSSISRERDGVHFLVRVPPGAFIQARNELTVHGVVEDEQGRPIALLDFAQQ